MTRMNTNFSIIYRWYDRMTVKFIGYCCYLIYCLTVLESIVTFNLPPIVALFVNCQIYYFRSQIGNVTIKVNIAIVQYLQLINVDNNYVKKK